MALDTAHGTVSTQEKLLEAAGRLFLERGYAGVSVRDITEVAGANVAAVNYHFGSKRNLYREFLSRRLTAMVDPKVAALEEIVQRSHPPDLRLLIRTYVSGFLGDVLGSREVERLMKLLWEEMSSEDIAGDVVFKKAAAPVHRVLKGAIAAARPEMDELHASLCISSIAGQIIHFLRAREIIKRVTGRGYSKEFVEQIVQHITEFSLRGIGA
jgi:AcrR family transcriptional regulator